MHDDQEKKSEAEEVEIDVSGVDDGSTPAKGHDPTADDALGDIPSRWPPKPTSYGELLTPVEAAQFLRLDETGRHTPKAAIRTMTYWRERGWLHATKYARQVWFQKAELLRFLEQKTEE